MPRYDCRTFQVQFTCKKSNESVSTFVKELRKLTEYCECRDSLNDMLRDRLSEGSIQFLDKAVDIALSLESAISQTVAIQSGI